MTCYVFSMQEVEQREPDLYIMFAHTAFFICVLSFAFAVPSRSSFIMKNNIIAIWKRVF